MERAQKNNDKELVNYVKSYLPLKLYFTYVYLNMVYIYDIMSKKMSLCMVRSHIKKMYTCIV